MLDQVLQNIAITSKALDCNEKELRHLESDLKNVIKRLKSREYQIRDFTSGGAFDYQQRTDEFYGYLKSYALAGKTFAKIFEAIKIKPKSTF